MRATNTQSSSEVLFQKLGNTWFVFTEIQGDMIYSALPEGMNPHTTKLELYEVLESHLEKVASHYTKSSRRKPEVAA